MDLTFKSSPWRDFLVTFKGEVPGIKMIGYSIPFFAFIGVPAAPSVFIIVLEVELAE